MGSDNITTNPIDGLDKGDEIVKRIDGIDKKLHQ